MGSMRSMGYTFESAVADIIDNSISANCSMVKLSFPKDSLRLYVTILDDGEGLDKEELMSSMRYGSFASEDMRAENDLGRFGLGLKAASLSQCKKLTVVSKKNGEINALQWDYNFIQECTEWIVLELENDEIENLPTIEELKPLEHGTLVIWEDFDILAKSSDNQVYSTLCDYKPKVSDYISLIFHRFISGKGCKRITMYVNNYKVAAADPFLESNSKTTRKKEFDIALPDSHGIERHIKVQPYILPFQKDLTDGDLAKIGGIESLRTKQGYYIYRNGRLIIWGTWFGMARNELTKNARIRVDIPNTLDDIWKIDIKKQNATIPKRIQNQLKRKVEEAMNISIRQNTHRGRKAKLNDEIDYLWNRIEGRDKQYFYEINRDSEFVNYIRRQVSDESYTYIEMLMDEIEKNIPYQQMYIDQANNSIIEKEDDNREDEIFQEAVMMIDFAVKYGSVVDDAIKKLMHSEPFCNSKELEEKLKEKYIYGTEE